ncbi:MAG: ABC transporter permease [Lachnospiraceae bacterium]|nr:ABC transporter permease [Lachnospiraceae bacterium]
MGKYIINEFVKALKRKHSKIFAIGLFVLCLVANLAVIGFRMIYGTNEGTFAYNIIEYATWCFVIPYYACILIADIVFGKDYPNPFIKDGYTKDLNRGQIYMGKVIASAMLAFVFAIIACVALLLITTLFHLSDGTIRLYNIKDFFEKMTYAVPLWLAGIGFGNMFLFAFKDKRYAYGGYFILTLLLERLIMMLAAEPFEIGLFKLLRTVTVSQNFSLIPYPADPARNIPLTIATGIIYFVVSCILGIILYRKKKFR